MKRCHHGEMALRWTAGMLVAEQKFRRVRGSRRLLQLLDALEAATADQPGTNSLERAASA